MVDVFIYDLGASGLVFEKEGTDGARSDRPTASCFGLCPQNSQECTWDAQMNNVNRRYTVPAQEP